MYSEMSTVFITKKSGYKEGKMRRVKRILLAKGGLDGHMRSLEELAIFFRDAGFEVIYLGMYQAPEAIAQAAFQEDVDVVGVSMLSGGHRGVFRELMSLFAVSQEEWAVIAGGIYPSDDQEMLKELGVRHIFLPGTSIQDEIIPALRNIELPERHDSVNELFVALRQGNQRALAKFITLLTLDNKEAQDLVRPESSRTSSHIVGFTGTGGVGKSSLIEHLVKYVYREGRVATLFVDPPALSGGVFLGDRIRLHRPETLDIVTSPNVFLRSLAAREVWKGMTRETPAVLEALRRARYETILLESVGVGQYDLGFKEYVDTMVLVVHPDMGDEIQMMKGGMIETADVIVVNKSDRPGADTAVSLLKHFFSETREDGWRVPVVRTCASPGTGEGIEELWRAIQSHRDFLRHYLTIVS